MSSPTSSMVRFASRLMPRAQKVAKRNSTVLVLNTEYILTELSSKVNGNTSGKPQASSCCKVVTPASF